MHMHVSAAFQHFDILGLLFGLSIGVALIIAFAGGGGAAALRIAALPPSLPECHALCIIIILSLCLARGYSAFFHATNPVTWLFAM
jgi:hypothetical protein